MAGRKYDEGIANRISMAVAEGLPISQSSLPPTVSALLGYVTNKDFWQNKDIWKGRKVSPHEEIYPDRTSPASRMATEQLAKIGIEVSPSRLDYSAGAIITGSNPLVQLLNPIYAKMDQTVNNQAFDMVSKIPGASRLIKIAYPPNVDEGDLVNKIKKYRIPIEDKNGNKKTPIMLKDEVKKSETKELDIRQENDVKMAELQSQYGNRDQKVIDFIKSVENPDEKKRLVDKYKKSIGKTHVTHK
jgi:hypothetical protein